MKLLLCPFCKGEPEIQKKGTSRQSMIIVCTWCGAMVESGDVFGLTSDKNLKWNHRAKCSWKEAIEISH